MKKFALEFKKAVVDDFNSERYTVAQIAKKHGVPVGLGAGIEDKVVSLHEGGRKMTEMVRELGLTAYAVRKVLVGRGLDTKRVHVDKPSETKSDRVRDDVLAAHNDGLGAADIAKRCGVSIPTVRKVLREAGVVPHKHTVAVCSAVCGEGKPLPSSQQQEELNQVVDQVGSKPAEGIVSQEDTGP